MRFRILCTALTLSALLAVPFPCLADTAADTKETAGPTKVVLTLGSSTAMLNDVPYQLEIPPEVVNGVSFLPIRFVTEQALGATIQWDAETKTSAITRGESQINLTMSTGQALVNGQEVALTSPPFIKDGRTLVPLRFLAENFNVQVDYEPAAKTITIIEQKTKEVEEEKEEELVNLPPVITSLGLQSNVLKIGEEAKYNFTYDNEAGESITAQEWSYQFLDDTQAMAGQPRAFFRPGTYSLSLRIQDAAGNWSETTTTDFTVANEKLMSEMVFKLSRPVYGELFENLDNVRFNTFAANADTTFEPTGEVLHLSNSPEVVSRHGILYQNEASGNFRLFFHHLNGAEVRQYFYLIAENNNHFPVTLKTIKSGVGGPVNDYMNLGQVISMRYLDSSPAPDLTLNPGEKKIIDLGLRHLNKDEAVTGMQDYQVDGSITLSVIMGPEKAPEPEPMPEPMPEPELDFELEPVPTPDPLADPDSEAMLEPANAEDNPPLPVKTPEELLQDKIDYLLSLPVLPSNSIQVRGFFPTSDCLVDIQASGSSSEKITLGQEGIGHDSWVAGVDPLTGEAVKNVGSYGVIYRIKITAQEKTGVMLNPRGSVFKAAFQAADGQVYKAPSTGFFTGSSGLQKAAILGVVEAGETKEFIYTPPSGSDTPLIIALLPESTWSSFEQ